MKIPELYEHKKPVFSLEIFPPKKKGNIESIYDTVEQLAHCNPDFISVTYGAGGNLADNSTCEIASRIKKMGSGSRERAAPFFTSSIRFAGRPSAFRFPLTAGSALQAPKEGAFGF